MDRYIKLIKIFQQKYLLYSIRKISIYLFEYVHIKEHIQINISTFL